MNFNDDYNVGQVRAQEGIDDDEATDALDLKGSA
jgi:hypothetical protein